MPLSRIEISARHRAKKRQALVDQGGVVICEICKQQFGTIEDRHLRLHNTSLLDYRKRFPLAETTSALVRKSRGSSSAARARFNNYAGTPPDNHLFEFLTGALLGDGNLSLRSDRHGHARYAEGGSNKEYAEWKVALLKKYLPINFKEKLSSPHSKTGKRYRAWWIRSGVNPLLTDWYKLWYPDHRKIVPMDLVTAHLTPFAMSVWYCDDGARIGNRIYTLAFSTEEVDNLCALIQCRFDVSARRSMIKGKPSIYIPAENKSRMAAILTALPGMEYKGKVFSEVHDA